MTLKAAEERRKAELSELEREREARAKAERRVAKMEAEVEAATKAVEAAERARRAEQKERELSAEFSRLGVVADDLDYVLDKYRAHIMETREDRTARKAPDAFAADLRKRKPHLFQGTAPARPSTAPAETKDAPPAEKSDKTQGDDVSDMDDVAFRKRTREKYGFNPSAN